MSAPLKALRRGLIRALNGRNPFHKKRRRAVAPAPAAPAPAVQAQARQAVIARNHAQAGAAAAPHMAPVLGIVDGGYVNPSHDAAPVAHDDAALHDPPPAAHEPARPIPIAPVERDDDVIREYEPLDSEAGWQTDDTGWSHFSLDGETSHDPSRHWHHDDGRTGQTRRIKTHGLPESYRGEDVEAGFRGTNYGGVMAAMNMDAVVRGTDDFAEGIDRFATAYMTPEQQVAHAISFDEHGRLRTAEGAHLDTRAQERTVDAEQMAHFEQSREALGDAGLAHHRIGMRDEIVTAGPTGAGTVENAGRGKHIFIMTPEGEIRAVDPWAAKTVTDREDGGRTLEMINHSSLAAGGEVAGAGELTVADGNLQQISDQSGHYRPDGVMMSHVLMQLDQFTDTSNVDVKFGGKADGQTPLIASSREFRELDPVQAEKTMRARRRDLDLDLHRHLEQDPRFARHNAGLTLANRESARRSDSAHARQAQLDAAAVQSARGAQQSEDGNA
jgi:hypothetical protein